jgi:hypothetical protein
MVMKTTNAYKRLRISYLTSYTVYLLHVSATRVAILSEMHYKGYVR